jgi:hypothetical protein
MRQRRGLSLEVICFAKNHAYCYVWVPPDDTAASQAMIGGDLHLKIAVEDFTTGPERLGNRTWHPLHFAVRRVYSELLGESAAVREIPLRRKLEIRTSC